MTKTRDIYEMAISELPTSELPAMCLRYANLERKLGEVDRARAIYIHGAQEVITKTKKQSPITGARANNTLHK